jgi:hypothetical protein
MIDPVILRKKAQKKRKDTGDERWKASIEKSTKSMARTVGYSLMRPFQILAYEPMALILNLYSAILLGILYLFFGAFPLVFEGVYGFNLWQTGLTFLGMLFGMFAGAMSSGVWVAVRARLIERNGGKLQPEFRLPAVIAGSLFVTVGLFWFAWTTLSWVHWILPIIGSGIFGYGVSPCPFLALREMRCGGDDVQRRLCWTETCLGTLCQMQSPCARSNSGICPRRHDAIKPTGFHLVQSRTISAPHPSASLCPVQPVVQWQSHRLSSSHCIML